MEPIIGIDLGTTNSCVAVMQGGQPVVIANRGGYKTTPSVVAISESGRRLVGHIAKRQAVTNARNTVAAAKRLIGRKWTHPVVEAARNDLPYELTEGDGGDVRVKLHDRAYAIPEISAMVLSEMKRVAEEQLGHPVSRAVITIPAYFNDGQRQATKDAGQIAGLDVIRIINEPTAAALAYGYKKDIHKKIAVYDLGGGTFDISILDIGEGVFEVLATAGDTFLGGEDFDRRIVDWLVFLFNQEHQVDLRRDPMSLQRLRDAAEKAKVELSGASVAEINLPFIISSGKNDALHMQRSLSREKLEELTADLVSRSIEICGKILVDAGISKDSIDEVLLVGGQTRMPAVQQAVRAFFGREPSRNVHPDEVVALGAAVQGHALGQADAAAGAPEMLLLDVTPYNLGIMIAGGYVQTLIEANTTVPTGKTHVFTTVRDNQTAVKIVVMQGDSQLAADNELLGEFVLMGLRPAPRGEVEIEVLFDISADGLVSVSAKDLETGKEQSIQVTASSRISDEEMGRLVQENEEYAVREKRNDADESTRTEVERTLREVLRIMPEVRELIAASDFGSDALGRADSLIEQARGALERRDAEALSGIKEPLERTLTMFQGLASKLNF